MESNLIAVCMVAMWGIGYYITTMTSRQVLIEGKNLFLDSSWVELTVLQQVIGFVLAIALLLVMGKPVLPPNHALDNKAVIVAAAFCNAIGGLAMNAAFTTVTVDVAHIVEACLPLVVILLVLICSKDHVLDLSSLLSVFTIVFAVCTLSVGSKFFSPQGFVTMVISTVAFSARNMLLNKLHNVWDDPVQKFLSVSSVGFMCIFPVWLVKVAITQSFSTSKILEFVTCGLAHPLYSIASFTVLELVTPIPHAILTVFIRQLSYTNFWCVSGNALLIILIVVVSVFLYRLNSTIWYVVKFLFLSSLFVFTIVPQLPMQPQQHTISVVWTYNAPIPPTVLKNIHTLSERNPNKSIRVYCGTTQCVKSVTALNLTALNVSAEFVIISEVVKDTPLQEWLAHHPLNKVLAGRAFETHLQEVTILGLLWKYGGFFASPMVTIKGTLKTHNAVAWVSRRKFQNHHSLFDVAYVPRKFLFIEQLAEVFANMYPTRRETGVSFLNFSETVWKTTESRCNATLVCPTVLDNEMFVKHSSDHSNLTIPADHFGLLSLSFAPSASSFSRDLYNLLGLQYLPFVDTFLENHGLESANGKTNITSFFVNDLWWKIPRYTSSQQESLNPILLSLCLDNDTEKNSEKIIAYLREKQPIGCCDISTLNFVKNHDIKAYFSGSPLLLINNPNSKTAHRSNVIYLADVEQDVFKLLPVLIQEAVIRVGQTLDRTDTFSSLRRAFLITKSYGLAKLVITQNLNHALLCVAVKTPVIYIQPAVKAVGENTVLTSLFHTLYLDSRTQKQASLWLSYFPWQDIPPNPNCETAMRLRATLFDVIRRHKNLHDSARKFGIVPMSPPSKAREREDLLFHLIFTTTRMSNVSTYNSTIQQTGAFNWRHVRCIESIFYHHPTSKVIMHSNTLQQETFDVFTEAGYSIEVHSYDIAELLRHSPAEAFIGELEKAETGRFWYSHETDLVRFLLLYKFGGVYMDTDVILVQPLNSLKTNTLGWQDSFHESLNGAVLIFEKNNIFMKYCLMEFAENYNGQSWDSNGPLLLTRIWQLWNLVNPGVDDVVQVLDNRIFYMIEWTKIKQECFFDTDGGVFDANLRVLKSEAYAVHLNSRITGYFGIGDIELIRGTIGSHLLNAFCVFCDRIY